jgi:hypothetical protein
MAIKTIFARDTDFFTQTKKRGPRTVLNRKERPNAFLTLSTQLENWAALYSDKDQKTFSSPLYFGGKIGNLHNMGLNGQAAIIYAMVCYKFMLDDFFTGLLRPDQFDPMSSVAKGVLNRVMHIGEHHFPAFDYFTDSEMNCQTLIESLQSLGEVILPHTKETLPHMIIQLKTGPEVIQLNPILMTIDSCIRSNPDLVEIGHFNHWLSAYVCSIVSVHHGDFLYHSKHRNDDMITEGCLSLMDMLAEHNEIDDSEDFGASRLDRSGLPIRLQDFSSSKKTLLFYEHTYNSLHSVAYTIKALLVKAAKECKLILVKLYSGVLRTLAAFQIEVWKNNHASFRPNCVAMEYVQITLPECHPLDETLRKTLRDKDLYLYETKGMIKTRALKSCFLRMGYEYQDITKSGDVLLDTILGIGNLKVTLRINHSKGLYPGA